MSSPVVKRAGWFTWLILATSVVFTLMTRAGQSMSIVYWLFDPSLIQHGQIWRLITPIFLHFSMFDSPITHLLFNGLWWFVVGGAIEKFEGSARLMLITLLSAVVSNIAAYWVYGPFFGGLSGVCYAIIAYAWLRSLDKVLYRSVVSKQLFVFFIVFMLIGFTGLMGNVANVAHLAGLVVGLILAAIYNYTDLNGRSGHNDSSEHTSQRL